MFARMTSVISRPMGRFGVALTVAIALVCVALPALAGDETEEENKIGKQAAEQVAKESKFIDDPELIKRVETVGKAVAKVATEKEIPATYGKSTVAKFEYTFKIIDDKDVNAFALPGGYVYVNKGLLDYVHSDDELAGVLAHEIAHVAHHHAMQLMKVQQKQMLGMAAAVLAGAALGGSGSDLSSLAYAANLINIARMSDYGQKAETDADRTAVALLAETKYNPVGMLTFMERLAVDEARKPNIEYGIFRTHPYSYSRAGEIIAELKKRNIPVNRRLVTNYMHVEARPVENSQAYCVTVGSTEIARVADSGGEKASVRADKLAQKLGSLLLAGATIRDVKVGGGGLYVVVMDQVIFAPTQEDADLAGKNVPDTTDSIVNALKRAFLRERLGQSY